MTKNIVWGDKPFAKNGERPTHKITSLYVLDYDLVQIGYEKSNGDTEIIKISMELAQEVGLIDFSKLEKIIK